MTAPVIWLKSMLVNLTARRPFLRPGRIAVVEERVNVETVRIRGRSTARMLGINQIVASGWSKSRQMRWSPTGAQLFLQVRTAVLNNDLADCFRRWYPGFTHAGGPAENEVDVAA
jgi:hypothetical protein